MKRRLRHVLPFFEGIVRLAVFNCKHKHMLFHFLRNPISCAQEPMLAALASLHGNPYVARIHGWTTTRTQLVVAQEFVPGGDLYSLLKGIRRIPERKAASMIAEVIVALAHLHRLGILHRDLKSENVLISADGHLKLIDFGLAADELELLSRPSSRSGRQLVPRGSIERWQAAIKLRRGGEGDGEEMQR